MLRSESTNGLCDFDSMELDADIAGFGESLSVYSKAEMQDLYLAISPTHSSDSGVDTIEECLFDFENMPYHSSYLWEAEGHSFEDMVADAYTPWPENRKGNDSVGSSKTRRKSKLEETIDEDHCYTSRVLEDLSSLSDSTNVLHSEMRGAMLSEALACKVKKSQSKDPIEDRYGAKSTKKIDKETLEEMILKGTSDKCGNRNAVMAKLNRERKKKYVSNLESEVSTLRKQNTSLTEENKNLKVSISSCREELAYLRNVLENQSMLSSVISAVSGISGVNLKGIVNASSGRNQFENEGSLSAGKEMRVDDNVWQKLYKTENGEQNLASFSPKGNGVCLHVQQENISIEFCHQCSAHATSSK